MAIITTICPRENKASANSGAVSSDPGQPNNQLMILCPRCAADPEVMGPGNVCYHCHGKGRIPRPNLDDEASQIALAIVETVFPRLVRSMFEDRTIRDMVLVEFRRHSEPISGAERSALDMLQCVLLGIPESGLYEMEWDSPDEIVIPIGKPAPDRKPVNRVGRKAVQKNGVKRIVPRRCGFGLVYDTV